jgi:hypothetical protein
MKHIAGPKLGAVWSYGKKQSVEAIRGHGETIFFECEHVSFYGFTDIANRAFFVSPWLTQPGRLGRSATQKPLSPG